MLEVRLGGEPVEVGLGELAEVLRGRAAAARLMAQGDGPSVGSRPGQRRAGWGRVSCGQRCQGDARVWGPGHADAGGGDDVLAEGGGSPCRQWSRRQIGQRSGVPPEQNLCVSRGAAADDGLDPGHALHAGSVRAGQACLPSSVACCSRGRPDHPTACSAGLWPAGTCSPTTTGPGGLPSPKGRPPSSSRKCGVAHPVRSGPIGTIPVGLMSVWTS